jgi:hypothetical protein
MVKANNQYNALLDGYLEKLGNTSEKDIVTFRKRREGATIDALNDKLKRETVEKTRLELKEEIEVHEKVLKKPKGWQSFEHYVLADKVAHGKYVRLQEECRELENKLDTIIDHDERATDRKKKLNELLKKKRLEAERQKWGSIRDLKRYVTSQVRPDLFACHGLI